MAVQIDERFDLDSIDNSILNPNNSELTANGEFDKYINNSLDTIITPETQNNSILGEDVDLRFPDNILNEANLFDEIFQPDNTELSINTKPLGTVSEFDETEKVSALPNTFINEIPVSSNPDTLHVVDPKKISKQQLAFGVGGLLLLTIIMVVK